MRAAHEARVGALIDAHVARRDAGLVHPVEDFLFTYYRFSPGHLRRWHPGLGFALSGPGARAYAKFSGYRVLGGADEVPAPGAQNSAGGLGNFGGLDADSASNPPKLAIVVGVAPELAAKRAGTASYIADLLRRTAARPAKAGCFALHEWAMVYRSPHIRHESVPLRLSRAECDAVVESLPLRCTHYDAFRFFTPDAVPRNACAPTRETQADFEQPGCLHAGMDLYKWAFKLAPLVDSELVADCFAHALAARALDMQASPYDLRPFGYEPVRIETPSGRAEFARRQRELAAAADSLRARLITWCDRIIGYTPAAAR
jgi:hypothetical protein